MKRHKRLSLFLAVALTLSVIAPGPLAAQRATASTLRLDAVEGTVTVHNRAGKDILITERMKLYSGYSVSSALASYGYISLDDTKAVKLDAKSEVQIKQSGQKLEVNLVSGNLLFDITAPLLEDESLNIRTSTMVTGIRGTAGFVKVINEKVSEVYLLSGEVHLTSTDPLTGQVAEVTLRPGQRATSYVRDVEWGEEIVEIVIDGYTEADVPGYVAVAIRDSLELQEAITEQTDLSVPLIIGLAADTLAADQAALSALQALADKAQSELDNAKAVDPLFKDEQSAPGGSSTPPQPTSITLNNANAADITAALSGYRSVTVSGFATIDANVNIDPGRTLTFQSNVDMTGGFDITNESPSTLIIEGSAQVYGAGTIYNGTAARPGRLIIGQAAIDVPIVQNNPESLLITEGTHSETITIYNGTATLIGDSNVTASRGVEVYGGTVNIAGSISSGNGTAQTVFMGGGTVNLKGGVIINTSAISGEGVAVWMSGSGSTFNMESGTISGANQLRAVEINDYSTFTMNAGTIENTGSGAAVGLSGNGSHGGQFAMEDGTITTGSSSDSAVVVGHSGGASGNIFALNGGTVTNNSMNSATIVVNAGNTFTGEGGSVENAYPGGTIVSSTGTYNYTGLPGSGAIHEEPAYYYTAPGKLDPIKSFKTLGGLLEELRGGYPTATIIVSRNEVFEYPITIAAGQEIMLVTDTSDVTLNFAAPLTIEGKLAIGGTEALSFTGTIEVPAGSTLTINPGSTLTLASEAELYMYAADGIVVEGGGILQFEDGSTFYTPAPASPYGIDLKFGGTVEWDGTAKSLP